MSETFNNSSIEPELQVRLMNLAMGEASDFERDQLQLLMEQRPELVAFYQHVGHLHELLSIVGAGDPEIEIVSSTVDTKWRLPADRRKRVLEVLESPITNPSKKVVLANRRSFRKWRITTTEAIVVASIACVLLGLMLPATTVARKGARSLNVLSRSERFDSGIALKSGFERDVDPRNDSTNDLYLRPDSFRMKNSPFYLNNALDASTAVEAVDSGRGIVATREPQPSAILQPAIGTASPAFSPDLDFAVQNNANATPPTGAPNSAVAEPPLPSSSSSSFMGYSDLPSITESSRTIWATKEAADKTKLGELLTRGLGEKQGTITNRPSEDFDAKPSAEDNVDFKLNRYAENHYRNDIELSPSLSPSNNAPVAYPTEEVWERLANRRLERFGSIDLRRPIDSLQGALRDDLNQLGQKNAEYEEYVDAQKFIQENALGEAVLQHKKENANGLISLPDKAEGKTASVASKTELSAGKFVTPKPATSKQPVTLDEQSASTESFSTFSLHVSDVSFKLAQAALSQSQWPEAEKIRIEEFVNAMDYHDPLPSSDQKIACRVEQAIHPFLMQRNLLRVSMRTAATGRSQSTPLRLTVLLDNSGSMERTDRRQALLHAFKTLTQQLNDSDQITLISFASTPRLLADKLPGNQGEKLLQLIENLPSQGGTNIEAALLLAREKAAEQKLDGAQNRIVLITDGAVNLGNANPESLAKQITELRDAGIAFDAAGISAQDVNDEVLEALTRKGDGRYYLLDSVETTGENFAAQIAGALRPSAQNVKVQVEFNPLRVGRYKLLGFEKHWLNKQDFRNDQVDAAEMAAAEAGVAVYQYEIKPNGSGDVGSVSVRFRDLSSGQMIERRWPILYETNTPRLEQAQASMQLAATAALFAAKLGGGPLADNVDLGLLQRSIAKLPEQFASQPRVQQLRAMIDQAIAIH